VSASTFTKVRHDGREDEVAVEEPLEIRVDGVPLVVTMRTPGADEELALGFLYGEGLIDGPRAAGPSEDFAANIVEVSGPITRDPGQRRFYTTSSCGVCGKGALEEVAVHSAPLPEGPTVPRALLGALPDRLVQPAFERTGGMHATGLFDRAGEFLLVNEDVGRHNAMDKVIGRALLDGLVPLGERILCVSGRLSFELVQKASRRRGADPGRRRRAQLARDLAGRRPRDDAVRLRPPRECERVHPPRARTGVTGRL
jgi:FdhD protein